MNIYKITSTIVFTIIVISCNGNKKHISTSTENKIVTANSQVDKNLEKSIGILSFDNSKTLEEKHFKILNKDETIFMKVSFSKENIVIDNSIYNLYDYEGNDNFQKIYNFNPFSFYPETGEIIHFEVLEITEKYYKIKINDNSFDYKLINKNEEIFKFKEWKTFIQDSFVYPKNNLIHIKPSENSHHINIELSEDSFKVVEFLDDNWLKIMCFKECNGCKDFEKKFYFIKWRKANGKLLIDFNYLC